MQITYSLSPNELIISLNGELDHLSAPKARKEADRLIDENLNVCKVAFDLTNVSFMDSTGIGFLIGRYKKLSRYQLPLYIRNPSPASDKVLDLSGIYSIIPKQ